MSKSPDPLQEIFAAFSATKPLRPPVALNFGLASCLLGCLHAFIASTAQRNATMKLRHGVGIGDCEQLDGCFGHREQLCQTGSIVHYLLSASSSSFASLRSAVSNPSVNQ